MANSLNFVGCVGEITVLAGNFAQYCERQRRFELSQVLNTFSSLLITEAGFCAAIFLSLCELLRRKKYLDTEAPKVNRRFLTAHHRKDTS